MSWRHTSASAFMHGDSILREAMNGLTPPDVNNRSFFLDIQPDWGIALLREQDFILISLWTPLESSKEFHCKYKLSLGEGEHWKSCPCMNSTVGPISKLIFGPSIMVKSETNEPTCCAHDRIRYSVVQIWSEHWPELPYVSFSRKPRWAAWCRSWESL